MMIIIIIILALIFEFINGFHDTANAVATVIGTRSLEPHQAIVISALFNLFGALSGTAVAITIAKGIVVPSMVTSNIILSGLVAAISWNLFTWYFGIPSSSSHALVGGLFGACFYNYYFAGVKVYGLLFKIILPMILSPLFGFILSFMVIILLDRFIFYNKDIRKLNKRIRGLQLFSTALLSFSHGSSDSQKTMGIITLALFNYHAIAHLVVPKSVILICAFAMSLGTFVGGVKIIKTLSTRVARLLPINGFVSELSSGVLLLFGAKFGLPMSTTHTVSGSIMGSGIVSSFGVNPRIVRNMITSWLLTIPVCGLLSSLVLVICNHLL